MADSTLGAPPPAPDLARSSGRPPGGHPAWAWLLAGVGMAGALQLAVGPAALVGMTRFGEIRDGDAGAFTVFLAAFMVAALAVVLGWRWLWRPNASTSTFVGAPWLASVVGAITIFFLAQLAFVGFFVMQFINGQY